MKQKEIQKMVRERERESENCIQMKASTLFVSLDVVTFNVFFLHHYQLRCMKNKRSKAT